MNEHEPKFPSPKRIGKRRFYPFTEIIAYERALAGLPPVDRDPAEERWLTAAQVRQRFGNVSDMWLWRREREAASANPEAA